ncbi:keratin-associated protein 10-4-like [Pimephales promelas]|uniref:keratin-associated protein 10-4-like n=1 Tax=Pimephales promelas TaxID=90988 RepID=UPI001955BE7A|nr:keratin-associated protein 10-4-like [Pimephales promelas]
MCALISFLSCADDSDCANNQKCCNNGCGLQCMDPVTAKPGVCPKTNGEKIRCIRKDYELCADDSECPKNQKCCRTACGGTRCTAPVTAMDQLDINPPENLQVDQMPILPGVCPSITNEPGKCARIIFVPCVDDSDCAYNQKCCNNGCGLQCMAPVTANPGVCPKTNGEQIRCIRKDYELCADDSECPKNQKCCRTACGGTRCTALVTVKPGVCPSKTYEATKCARIRFMSCVDDSDCANNQKCCSNGCGLQCMTPVTADPGVCPSRTYEPEMCALIRFVSCADDSDCTNNEKCCNNGCGLQCMAPVTVKPGVCPKTDSKIRCIRKDYELCADDSECPKNQKCCRTACGGTRCTAPVAVNPGVCPRRTYEAAECAWIRFEPCVDDSDCAINLKCCNNGCGLQCIAPVYYENTEVSPITNNDPAKCSMKGFVSCTDDSECPKNQKCCSTSCGGSLCMVPVTVNPGVCPRRTYEAAECAWIRFEPCVDDSDCAINLKCCNNGCGLQCIAPVYYGLP